MKNFDNIIFFNHFHNGDVHVSRTFIQNIINQICSSNYIYTHNNSYRLLFDIKNLKYKKIDFEINKDISFEINNNNLFINTWIGQNNFKYIQNGCNFIGNYSMYKDMFENLNILIDSNVEKYLPSINYNCFNIDYIDLVLNNDNREKVLISNCKTESCQCPNFDFDPIIEYFSDKYKNILFLITDETCINKKNVLYTKDIICNNCNDLNENSYISTKCKVIIGRSSGSYTFSLVKENLLDKNKKFIVFCTNSGTGCWYCYEKCETIYSNRFDLGNIINVIDRVLINI